MLTSVFSQLKLNLNVYTIATTSRDRLAELCEENTSSKALTMPRFIYELVSLQFGSVKDLIDRCHSLKTDSAEFIVLTFNPKNLEIELHLSTDLDISDQHICAVFKNNGETYAEYVDWDIVTTRYREIINFQ